MEFSIGDDEGVRILVSGDCLLVRAFGYSDEAIGMLTTTEARIFAEAICFICDRMEGHEDGN